MGSSEVRPRNGGSIVVYNYDKGVDVDTNRHVIPVWVTDQTTHEDVCVHLTAQEAAELAHNLLSEAEALTLSER